MDEMAEKARQERKPDNDDDNESEDKGKLSEAIEGPLKGKEPGLNGTYYLKIGLTKVEVDAFTYDSLEIGEMLRIRCTRSQKAINIDRIVPPQNGSK